MEVIGIPIIVALTYGIIEVLKLTIKSEKFYNFIPLIAAVLGITFSLIAYFFVPEIVPSTNILSVLFLGICSGLSATGCNQLLKQIMEINNNSK